MDRVLASIGILIVFATAACGTSSSGGSGAGGSGASGGASGAAASGGATASGGVAVSSGGNSAQGGATASGGAPTSSGGNSAQGGATASGGSSQSGGAGADLDASSGTTLTGVHITWYGFNDNSCQVETQHNCNTIAFPKSDGWNVPHDIATEGAGTYADPNTFATAANDDGSNAEIAPGALIYVPEVRKYFVMEDQCFECGQEWTATKSPHVDLWMGPSFGSDNASLTACEDKLTLGSPNQGTGTIIVNPPADLPTDTTPLFQNDQCTAHTYAP